MNILQLHKAPYLELCLSGAQSGSTLFAQEKLSAYLS